MTTNKLPPREFWIITGFYHHDSIRHSPFPEKGYDFPWEKVIVYSSYLEALEQCEKLAEALESVIDDMGHYLENKCLPIESEITQVQNTMIEYRKWRDGK